MRLWCGRVCSVSSMGGGGRPCGLRCGEVETVRYWWGVSPEPLLERFGGGRSRCGRRRWRDDRAGNKILALSLVEAFQVKRSYSLAKMPGPALGISDRLGTNTTEVDYTACGEISRAEF